MEKEDIIKEITKLHEESTEVYNQLSPLFNKFAATHHHIDMLFKLLTEVPTPKTMNVISNHDHIKRGHNFPNRLYFVQECMEGSIPSGFLSLGYNDEWTDLKIYELEGYQYQHRIHSRHLYSVAVK